MSILLFESEGSKRCEKNRNNKMKIKGVKKMNGLPFLTESGSNFEETATVGGFSMNQSANDFDSLFTEAANAVSGACDYKTEINTFIKSKELIDTFKDALLSGFYNESVGEDGELTPGNLYEEVSQLYDNTVNDLVMESTRVGNLLPVKSVDLPLVVRSHAKCISKAIVDTEITKSPVIKKQIERTWVVDPKTQKRWQYPQCFFNDEYKEIFKAGKGLPINTKQVNLPLFDYDIIDQLTDASIPTRENITINIQIDKVYLEDGTEVVLKRPMTVNLADGQWVGGVIRDVKVQNKSHEDVTVNDIITGFCDFVTNKITLSSASGQIKGVSFTGYLSNEKNERAVTWDYTREDMEWKIEDGFRTDIPYSLEQLEDAKALLNEDLYKKTYVNLNDILVQMEDSQTLDYLDEMFKKYDGAVLDPLDFNPFVAKRRFDCDSTIATTALPSEFIATQLKFTIDRFLIQLADTAKLEDLTFVIYGNPRYISLLDPNVNWVVRQGDTVGGVKLNYSYGVMTSGNIKVKVVSAMKINAASMNTLRIIPFPTTKDTITFKHWKYSSHIMTAANSAYRSPDLPGGSATYLMGTSRYTNAHVQGIQGDIAFDNADFV